MFAASVSRRVMIACLALLCGAAAFLAGCGGGGGGGGSAPAATDVGNVAIGLTDAEGDFVTYAVDILSLTLTRANGAVVETLPLTTRVDFADTVEMTEFLTAATVPAGRYKGASMRLDYGNADIRIENAAGEPVAAEVRYADGNPVGVFDVAVELTGRNALVVAPGLSAHMVLDFDLAASNAVDTTVTPPRVTLQPILFADTSLVRPKEHRVRGLLETVSRQRNEFELRLQPFHARTGHFGSLTVSVTQDTVYEINGATGKGDDGLAALAGLERNTPVIAIGDCTHGPFAFTARQVYAGISVPWAMHDVVHGHVVARNGDKLVVRGATIEFDDGRAVFNDNVLVDVDAQTNVRMEGRYGVQLTKDAISVGQRVTVFGTRVNSQSGVLVDATSAASLVRMLSTTVRGTVKEFSGGFPGRVRLDLQSIGNRSAAIFDFDGTGTPNADRDDYRLDTGSLSLASLTIGAPIQARGFVTAFGDAPPDFEAETIVNVAATNAILTVGWPWPGAANVLSFPTTESIELDLAHAGLLHHVLRGATWTDLTGLAHPTTIVPAGGDGLYAVVYHGSVSVFLDFASFVEALQERLAAPGALVRGVSGLGAFADATAQFAATRCAVVVQ